MRRAVGGLGRPLELRAQDGCEALDLGLVLALVGQVCKLVAIQAALSQAVVAW